MQRIKRVFAPRSQPFTLVAKVCLAAAGFIAAWTPAAVRADDWPQWRGPKRDGVWREEGIVARFAEKQLPLRWRAEVGPGYSGPTVADGRVLVTDRQTKPKQTERVHAFAAEDGKKLWTFEYDCPYSGVGYEAGPRACVTLLEGRAYALGAMGHLHCLNAADGSVVWKKDCLSEYKIRMPIWGIAAAPLVFEKLLIVQIGGEHACLVAFDAATGKEAWKALDDRASYAAPILVEQGGKPVLVCWTGDSVAGLDPQSGKVYWRHPFPPKNMVIGVATPVVDKDRLFVTSFYDGSLLLKLKSDSPAVEEVWRKRGADERHTEALHSIISTPFIDGEHIYGDDSYGELRCLKIQSGERVWENLTATPPGRWSNIHFVRHGAQTFLFNEAGELIIAQLSPEGFKEISRTKVIEPTREQLSRKNSGVTWAHPAFAQGCIFARSDKEIVCSSLRAAEQKSTATGPSSP